MARAPRHRTRPTPLVSPVLLQELRQRYPNGYPDSEIGRFARIYDETTTLLLASPGGRDLHEALNGLSRDAKAAMKMIAASIKRYLDAHLIRDLEPKEFIVASAIWELLYRWSWVEDDSRRRISETIPNKRIKEGRLSDAGKRVRRQPLAFAALGLDAFQRDKHGFPLFRGTGQSKNTVIDALGFLVDRHTLDRIDMGIPGREDVAYRWHLDWPAVLFALEHWSEAHEDAQRRFVAAALMNQGDVTLDMLRALHNSERRTVGPLMPANADRLRDPRPRSN